jgi:hypothetical protein
MKKKNNYEKFIKILNDTKIQYDTMDKSKIDPYGNFVSFKLLKLRDGFSNREYKVINWVELTKEEYDEFKGKVG